MASLRCTGRLLKRLRVKASPDDAEAETRLGDWYANVLNIGSNRLVMATSERTLLTVIVPIRDPARLRERIREAVHNMLFRLQIPPDLAADEVKGMDRMPFQKTANRSVLGSMNDFTFQAKHYFMEEPGLVDLGDVQLFLVGMPCGAIQYRYPADEVYRAFGITSHPGPA